LDRSESNKEAWEAQSLISKSLLSLVAVWLLVTGVPDPAVGAPEVVSFAYLARENDPAYAPHRAYTGLVLRDRAPPLDGAKAALKESRVIGRALGLKFELEEVTLGEVDDAVAAIEAMVAGGAQIFLLDLPLADVKQAAKALAGENVLLFNIRHGADELRGADCSPVLFHTFASDAMLMDGLAQYLSKMTWRDVLILEGESEADRLLSATFQGAARKFGLNVVDVRPFVLSNDPRLRDQTNVPLLTGDANYDVVFLADTLGEFGRYVPYQTYAPRPVVGSEGLVPGAWHWTWERYGAPQLNQRFDRIAGRRMQDADYAAWAAVKSVVEAMARTESRDVAVLRDYLKSDDFTLDTYKGVPGTFRAWDNQLRQAVLLHTHNAVIASAPLEGFLHQTNNLDTLGSDQPESACRFD
jgi:ABC transporter substrate binding protein (PQQ-dependent alcohol dehydrogenase system)